MRRYSRERAPRSLGENIQYYSLVSLEVTVAPTELETVVKVGTLAQVVGTEAAAPRGAFGNVVSKDVRDGTCRLRLGRAFDDRVVTIKLDDVCSVD